MKQKAVLEQEDAQFVMAGAVRHAHARGWAVTIAVVDDGGHLLALLRLDGAPPMSAEMAMGKARTAALARRDSKRFEEMINQGRPAFLSAPGLPAMLEGGVVIEHDGQVIGAVGVSGRKSSEDAEVAQAGIRALLEVAR